ncbi:hypothetical protein C3747_35g386c [Trypanosoma cruzi]|uniref:Uncharacterized protein n=1 Tax=Trypanosoma cruzi TaxID=5693 RepID=A0A2V2X226_TRYCR|nr:hypothetical protein C3747_35g386c [Trypanosoma cruzi]
MPPRFAKNNTTPFKKRVANLFQMYKRDLFFSCVALVALGVVFRRELMLHGVIGAPKRTEVLPKVEREFGKGRRQRSNANDT